MTHAEISGLSRRTFLAAGAAAVATLMAASGAHAGDNRPRRIVLVSSWQMVNIGDIGHTPGMLHVLEKHAPDAEVTLWARSMNPEVRAILNKRFPKVSIVMGSGDAKFREDASHPLTKALLEMDLLVHSSGPSVVAQEALKIARSLKKPYGVFGVTLDTINADQKELYSGAAFFFCRDTLSLKALKDSGVTCPCMEFTPDAATEIDLKDDERARAYLKAHDLKEREFICAIPRLRYTPYPVKNPNDEAAVKHFNSRQEVSQKFVEVDHAKLREVIVTWVQKTGKRVLICPEMTYQVEVAKKHLYDPLPEEIKKNAVWRDSYWWPDEACSVYAWAHTVVSFEMHSPLFSLAHGTPTLHLRQPTDTRKGQMMRDFGLSDWVFEIDDTTGAQIADRLMKIHDDYPAAQETLKKAVAFINTRHAECMAVVNKAAV